MLPWKENCPHIENGWCVACVSALGDAMQDYLDNDGSRGVYNALALEVAKIKLDRSLACNSNYYKSELDIERTNNEE